MNIATTKPLSRRMVLRGLGATMALPFLEAMQPLRAATPAAAVPTRFAFIYIPNGVVQDAWYPRTTGADYQMPPTLAALEPFRKDLNIVTGMDRTFAGGTGVHAQAGACWLTSSPPDEPLDGGFPTAISLDQMLARQLGRETMLPSLELSANDHTNNKETKYFESVSWHGPGNAAGVIKDPRAVFDRLFSAGDNPATRSVLDAVMDEAKSLRRKLGTGDRHQLDDYLDSVRATESRIERATKMRAALGEPPLSRPAGIPEHRGEYIQLMADLMILAFQQDRTRVATFVIDPERWDTPREYHGVFEKPQNHHVLTHTKGDEAKETLTRIDRFHIGEYAKIVTKLAAIEENGARLLDHSAVAIGSGLGDGRVHDYRDLPLIVAGSAGGKLRTGEHHRPDKGTPIANLWLSLLAAAGVPTERFADSTTPYQPILRS